MKKSLIFIFFIFIVMWFLSNIFWKSDNVLETEKYVREPNWDVYIWYLDDKVASVYVDLGLKNIAPIKKFHNQYRFTIDMLNPRDDWLLSKNESSILYWIEDDLLTLFEAKGEVLYAGRTSSDGKYTLYFYVEDGFNFTDFTKDVISKYKKYNIRLDSAEDPEWLTYLEFLFPSPEQYQIMQNSRVVNSLQEKWDISSILREVNHWIFFRNEIQRESYFSVISKEWFKKVSENYNEVFWEFPYRLEVSRNDKTDISSVNEYILYLWREAKEYEWEYDGWETWVVSE